MSKPIELTHAQFEKLIERLKQDYPPSVIIIRSRMKEKLGFTTREYTEWEVGVGIRKRCMMLDFYSEKKRTFFIMKYSDYIQKNLTTY
jgi:hypothetical protein